MKKIYILLFLLSSFVLKAQEAKSFAADAKNEVSQITSLKFTASSAKELEEIKWNDIKSIFESNKPEDKIELSFGLDLKESKNKFKGTITTEGKTKDIDTLIKNSKKIIKALIKISKNR